MALLYQCAAIVGEERVRLYFLPAEDNVLVSLVDGDHRLLVVVSVDGEYRACDRATTLPQPGFMQVVKRIEVLERYRVFLGTRALADTLLHHRGVRA